MLDMQQVLKEIEGSIEHFGIKCFKAGEADTKRTINGYIKTIEENILNTKMDDCDFRIFLGTLIELIKKELDT